MSPGRPPPPRWLVLGLAVLAVVATGVISLLPFLGDIDRVDDEPDGSTTVTTAPPRGDDFDRPDGPLAGGDRAWTQPAGGWAVQDGHAALVEPGDEPALAVLDDGRPWTAVRVTATAVEPGWGFAFLVDATGAHWAVVARSDRPGWGLVRVVDGRVEDAGDLLMVEPRDGALVEVALRPEGVVVTVDGVAAEPRSIDTATATGVGLAAYETSAAASMAWDDLTLS